MISEEQRKERNRVCALKYYHTHKKLKREPKEQLTTLEEYMEQKRQYYKEYYQRHKNTKKMGSE